MKALLRAEGLAVSVGAEKHEAVRGVSFSVYPGEITGIAGESGCGKSLTALSLAGLLPAQARVERGSIRFGEKELSRLPEKEFAAIRGKEISFVFQEPFLSLNPLMKAGPQIAETLLLHGGIAGDTVHGTALQKTKKREMTRAAKERVLDLMARLGFDDPARVYESFPHELSGGMCQRVMIALAMICGPKLLIADEPTTALDVTIQAQILELMKKINRDLGTAILIISHDIGVLRSICSRVLVMYAGRIVEEGKADEVFSQPLHEYTKGLAGSIPARNMKGKKLASIPGRVPPIEERISGCPFAPRCEKAVKECADVFGAEDSGETDGGTSHISRCIFTPPNSVAENQEFSP